MGFLTTIVFWNDSIHDLLKKPKDLLNLINSHISGGTQTQELDGIKLFKPIHTRDETIYVQMGGTIHEMNPYSTETRQFMRDHPESFYRIISYLEAQAEKLRELREDYPSPQ